jgi:hypothetical protein
MTKTRHPTLEQVLRRDRLVISIVLGMLTGADGAAE